jgi:diamine N-acetyltransferase
MGMKSLKGEHIYLRALEPGDLDFLYELENDMSVWEVSNTTTPYSKYVLRQYLDNSHKDIFEVKQLRLVIVKHESDPVGFIDLFDFEPKHRRVGLGIVVFRDEDRKKGYASEALQLTTEFVFSQLNVHQIYANITQDNEHSIKLFQKLGFVETGIKKDWILSEGKFKNEHIFQLLSK